MTTRPMLDVERLLDNAATASQCRELLRDDGDDETPLREAVRLNVAEPLLRELEEARGANDKLRRDLAEVRRDVAYWQETSRAVE